MEKGKTLEYYKNLNYEVVIKKKGNLFWLIAPDLICVSDDKSLEKAYEKLEVEKEKVFRRMIEWDCQKYIPYPRGDKVEGEGKGGNNYVTFLVKLLMVTVLLGLLGAFALNIISSKVRRVTGVIGQPEHFLLNKIKGFNNKFEHMDEGKNYAIRSQFRKMVENIKPFVDDYEVIMNDLGDKKP